MASQAVGETNAQPITPKTTPTETHLGSSVIVEPQILLQATSCSTQLLLQDTSHAGKNKQIAKGKKSQLAPPSGPITRRSTGNTTSSSFPP